MKYQNITTDDMLNGEGLRVVLWVSGCSHHCKGCHNPITWNPDDGLEFDDSVKQEIFEQLSHSYIQGLTLSGGDPMYPGNRDAVTELAKKVKEKFSDKDIWLYTGYSIEEIQNEKILDFIDVLVDGPFIEELKDNTLQWRGSANQRVIFLEKRR